MDNIGNDCHDSRCAPVCATQAQTECTDRKAGADITPFTWQMSNPMHAIMAPFLGPTGLHKVTNWHNFPFSNVKPDKYTHGANSFTQNHVDHSYQILCASLCDLTGPRFCSFHKCQTYAIASSAYPTLHKVTNCNALCKWKWHIAMHFAKELALKTQSDLEWKDKTSLIPWQTKIIVSIRFIVTHGLFCEQPGQLIEEDLLTKIILSSVLMIVLAILSL